MKGKNPRKDYHVKLKKLMFFFSDFCRILFFKKSSMKLHGNILEIRKRVIEFSKYSSKLQFSVVIMKFMKKKECFSLQLS